MTLILAPTCSLFNADLRNALVVYRNGRIYYSVAKHTRDTQVRVDGRWAWSGKHGGGEQGMLPSGNLRISERRFEALYDSY